MMKKNILIIYTGGTICTTIKDGKMSTDENAASALTTLFDKSDSLCKDKIKFTDDSGAIVSPKGITLTDSGHAAVSALVMLGFVQNASQKVVSKLIKEKPSLSVEAIIKEALKRL